MINEEMIDDFEEKQTIAMARLEAYRKVIESVKRMYDLSERKVKEAKMAVERSGDSSTASVKLKQKALQAKAESDVYYEVMMAVGKSAKECKEAMMRDVREFNDMYDSMSEAAK